jgi:hypothetical protein
MQVEKVPTLETSTPIQDQALAMIGRVKQYIDSGEKQLALQALALGSMQIGAIVDENRKMRGKLNDMSFEFLKQHFKQNRVRFR